VISVNNTIEKALIDTVTAIAKIKCYLMLSSSLSLSSVLVLISLQEITLEEFELMQ
jgi:hypothetical protein